MPQPSLRLDVGARVTHNDLAATLAALAEGRPVVWVGRQHVLRRHVERVRAKLPDVNVQVARWPIGEHYDGEGGTTETTLSDRARALLWPRDYVAAVPLDGYFTRERPARRRRGR